MTTPTITESCTSSLIPTHVAIIMDGNRRWATKQGLKTIYGHKKGYERLREMVDSCIELGMNYLTVYAFSSENLKNRSELEKKLLFGLMKESINDVLNDKKIMENGIKINFFGRWYLLPQDLQEGIRSVISRTEKNKNFGLNICLVYDGQEEILDATKQIIKDVIEKKIDADSLNKDLFKSYLYTRNVPPPDLIIRTGMEKEKRLSGFLLWDSSYAEFYFTGTFWPEFDKKSFLEAIEDYSQRKRRFGK